MSFVNQGIGLMAEEVYALIENVLALYILLEECATCSENLTIK